MRKRVIERPEPAFLNEDAPAPPNNSQAGHHRDGEVDAEYASDFSARENTE